MELRELPRHVDAHIDKDMVRARIPVNGCAEAHQGAERRG
jgi:hypothetical protein